MKNLTDIVQRTKELARGNLENYPVAATKALAEFGYPKPHQQVGVTMYLSIDVGSIKYSDRTSLLSLVTACLGQQGGNTAAINQAKARQTLFVF